MSQKEIFIAHEKEPFPGSMWPLDRSIVDRLPAALQLDPEQVTAMQYPWEVLTAIDEKLQEAITETMIDPSVEIPESTVIRGPVWIEKGARVHAHSELVGPLYIGEGALVGNHTHVRGSFIGNGTVVGERTSIVRSVVGENATFHENYVGDSIIMDEVDMGGGGKTANLRLDRTSVKSKIDGIRTDSGLPKLGVVVGAGAKFGADWLTMPGVKIGKNSLIGPKVTVMQDIPDNTSVSLKQDLEIKPIQP